MTDKLTPEKIARGIVMQYLPCVKPVQTTDHGLTALIAAAIAAERERAEKAEAERDECRAAQEMRAKAIRDQKDKTRTARAAALREAAEVAKSLGALISAREILALIDKEPQP